MRRRARIAVISLAWALSLGTAASAQETAALGSGPLALDAADGVEWRREERIFVAEGDAVARQGDVSLKADRLVAAYRDGAAGKLEIFRVDAEGHVRIENGADAAEGTRAAFDLENRAILLTGPGLSYRSGEVRVNAADTLEYLMAERRAVARGAARVTDPRGEISAGVIEARLKERGGVALARAWGDVTIRTSDGVVQADRAEYDFNTRKALAVGNVRIARDGDILTGGRATVDFQTGVSRLSGGADGDGRVKGLVFPKANR